MKRVLYVEDDETLAYLTADNLMQAGYLVEHVSDGLQALKMFQESHFDICVLDIMLPGMDGFALADAIRKMNHEVPILFLSAKTLKEDRIKGLKIGADDYILKPFSIEELTLKIQIFLNRSKKANNQTNIYTVGKFVFDSQNYILTKGLNQPIKLTQKEAQLLKFFIDNKNQVVRREQILVTLWGEDDYFMGRSLDVFISRLRKIFTEEESIIIENIHSIGFKFVVG